MSAPDRDFSRPATPTPDRHLDPEKMTHPETTPKGLWPPGAASRLNEGVMGEKSTITRHPAAVEFTLLGPFAIRVGGERCHVGGRNSERLLAALLLQPGRLIPIGRLISSVWDCDTPATADHQIRKAVGQLRSALAAAGGVRIHTDGSGYRVEIPPDTSDLARFDRALSALRHRPEDDEAADELRSILHNWVGPALAGMDTPGLRSASQLLDDRRVSTLILIADLDLAAGRYAAAVEILAPAVAEAPLAETLRSRLVLALYRCGQRADAMDVYHHGRRSLREELGLDPGPELSHAYQLILQSDPGTTIGGAPATATPPKDEPVSQSVPPELRLDHVPVSSGVDSDRPADPTVISTLPYDLPDFTGRTAEFAALRSLLPAPTGAPALTMVSVQGMPGVGKTAFAVHVGHLLRDQFPDGQLFIDLHGLTHGRDPLTPAEGLDRLLRWTGVPGSVIPDDTEERIALWRSRTSEMAFILVLDNVIDSPQAAPLIPGSDRSLVVLTSRMALHGIDGAVLIPLAPPPERDALSLLTAILGPDRVAAERPAAEELIRRCGHLPLAIRVAAARLQSRPTWTIAGMVARLRQDRPTRELTVGGRRVEAAIELSYSAVDVVAQRTFRLLAAVPADSVTPYLAAAISGTDEHTAEQVLEGLLDSRLLESRSPDRYQLHDLMRSFALGLLDRGPTTIGPARPDLAEPEAAQAVRGFHDALLAAVKEAAAALDPGRRRLAMDFRLTVRVPEFPDPRSAFDWLDAEYENLVAAARSATAAGLPLHTVHYARDLWLYLVTRGRYVELDELTQLAIDAAHDLGEEELEAQALTNAFVPLWRRGEVDLAKSFAERGLQLARKISARRLEAGGLGNVALVLAGQGRLHEALDYCERALAVHREIGNHRAIPSILTEQVLLLTRLGQYARARDLAVESIGQLQNHPNAAVLLVPMVNLARLDVWCGDAGDTVARLSDYLEQATTRSIPYAMGDAALALAQVLSGYIPGNAGRALADGVVKAAVELDLDRALGHAVQARDLLAQAGDPAEYAESCSLLGWVLLRQGDAAAALQAYRAAARSADRVHDVAEQVRALAGQAEALAALYDPSAAAVRRGAEQRASDLDPAEAAHLLDPR